MLIREKQIALSEEVGKMWSSNQALRVWAGRSKELEINVECVGDSESH